MGQTLGPPRKVTDEQDIRLQRVLTHRGTE